MKLEQKEPHFGLLVLEKLEAKTQATIFPALWRKPVGSRKKGSLSEIVRDLREMRRETERVS